MKNYRFVISYSPEREVYLARSPELEQSEVEAPTRAEAVAKLEEEMEAQLENIKGQQLEPPPPVTEREELNGELTIKVSPQLHQELAFLAQYENVELPVLLTELLTRAVSHRWTGGRGRGRGKRDQRDKGHRRNREGQGQRYHDIMENRADFIVYVRRQESGGQGRGGRGGGRGGGGRRGRR